MKLKISLAGNPFHSGSVTCLGWSGTEEVCSCGDDNQLVSWSVSENSPRKISQFDDLYPIDMQFLPQSSGNFGKQGDIILMTAADGKFHILTKNGRIERTIEAHKGAVLVGLWSDDGVGFLTAGEDGYIKTWSRSGMLRSVLVSSDRSVYSACWSPDCLSVAYTCGKCIVLKHLAPNTKPVKWKAHEGLVLCLAWSNVLDLIVSGGEDCRYRVWDTNGRSIYSSGQHDHHILSAAWSPTGDLFAVGSFNTLRLCDYSGWSRSLEKPNTGSIYKLSWSPDGTQLAGACANGHVVFANVIERRVHYANFTATLTERRTVTVKDARNDNIEVLDIAGRVIHMAMKYSNLVLTTPNQCYIYNTTNWNTPVIFDLKDDCVILVLLAEKHLLLVEKNSANLYNYQGRLIASPRWPNMRPESLKTSHISLSNDTLIVKDYIDSKVIYMIDLLANRSASKDNTIKIKHDVQITQISLNQCGSSNFRNIAVLDKTKDLHIVPIKSNKISYRLGRKIDSFQWNAEDNIIAAIQDAQLVVWYCANIAYDRHMLKLCTFLYESSDLGRSPRINDFVSNSVDVRRSDGTLINVRISPFPSILTGFVHENKWQEALELCRSTNSTTLWACLAVFAIQVNDNTIDIAEEAFANINSYDKVYYIQRVRGLPTKVQEKAAIALIGGRFQEAESILLHNGMVFQAILTNIQLHYWNKALDLALKNKTHIDTVLYLRDEYLKGLGKTECNKQFLSVGENIKYDIGKVMEKIQQEQEKLQAIGRGN